MGECLLRAGKRALSVTYMGSLGDDLDSYALKDKNYITSL